MTEPDVKRLREFRAVLDRIFADNLALGKRARADSESGGRQGEHLLDAPAERGERVAGN